MRIRVVSAMSMGIPFHIRCGDRDSILVCRMTSSTGLEEGVAVPDLVYAWKLPRVWNSELRRLNSKLSSFYTWYISRFILRMPPAVVCSQRKAQNIHTNNIFFPRRHAIQYSLLMSMKLLIMHETQIYTEGGLLMLISCGEKSRFQGIDSSYFIKSRDMYDELNDLRLSSQKKGGWTQGGWGCWRSVLTLCVRGAERSVRIWTF